MARRVMLQPAACPSPILQNASLPSLKTGSQYPYIYLLQIYLILMYFYGVNKLLLLLLLLFCLKTWTDMMSRLEKKYGRRTKKTKTKRRRPTKTKKKCLSIDAARHDLPSSTREKKGPPASTCPCLTWCKPFLVPTRS